MSAGGTALVVGGGGLAASAALALASGGADRVVLACGPGGSPARLLGWLRALGPAGAIEADGRTLSPGSALELLRGAGALVVAAEDLTTQFVAGAAALRAGVPTVHAGILRSTLQLLTVRPGSSACLWCLFEDPPTPGTVPGAAQAGALGPAAQLGGALAGAEALRLLAGERGAYEGRLLSLEVRSARARAVPVRRRSTCRACRVLQGRPGAGGAG